MSLTRMAALGVAALAAGCFPGAGSGLTGIGGGDGSGAQQRTLAFAVQPSNANEGEIITPAIQVAARDSLGNTDVTFTGNVTVALGANSVGGFLEGTKTVAAVFGVASFGDLSVDRPGSYALLATASGATAATSAGFTIVTPP